MSTDSVSKNLQRLRSANGLSQAELAEAAGLSRPAYRAIEKGASVPRVDTLMAIARALEVDLADLVAPVRQLSQVRFRARKRMKSRAEVLASVARWLDAYGEMESMVGRQRAPSWVEEGAPRDPVPAARWAREKLKLGPREAIRDICGLLEDQGGIKVYAPVVASDLFFGLSVGAEGGGPAVVVNTWDRIAVERWIFSAAHELGHLVMHLSKGAYDETVEVEDEDEEREADLFASHFLMPAAVFADEWGESRGLPFIDRVFKLKKIFHVSYKTVLYRLQQDHGEREIWKRFQVAYKRRYGKGLPFREEPSRLEAGAFSGGASASVVRGADEPERLSRFYFVSDRLQRLVREAFEAEKITLSRGAEVLGTSLPEMRELAAGWVA